MITLTTVVTCDYPGCLARFTVRGGRELALVDAGQFSWHVDNDGRTVLCAAHALEIIEKEEK